MKYSDLIQFEPIESVVQLREADTENKARQLVETFVVSDRMAELLGDIVVPQLQFSTPADNKGLLVVGNYGTGKSHLMAVISAIAERADLVQHLTNPALRERAAEIAGRFKVIRAEIGATEMSLRDIVGTVLEEGLERLGVSYKFPEATDRHENKSAFEEMMAEFDAEHPDLGLVLVVDELLDYLRSRKDQEFSQDLSFLRELGEVCKNTRFRFVSGVQESLFDNPRFNFVADTLLKVKDRFEQVRIAREDVAFVVAERLLRKDARQKALVREHLTRFAPMYGSMNERMDDFVRLYPVHPAYLDTFERVYVAEKREVLKTLTTAIGGLLDVEVPENDTGVVAYDTYWETLRSNASFKAVHEIKEVIEKGTVLEARLRQAYTRKQYQAMAIRIVHALAVHRLTTGDIYAPLGATAEELRDDLCLMLPDLPEKDAGFLQTVVETALKETLRTVSGQFISFNEENGQYFIDLKKDVDFDALIERKAETLADAQLDRHYFDALRRVVLEDPDATEHAPGYRIWEHEIEWRDRKAGRDGYLFFGAPNERSTAQPPRDFYLYFLQPFDRPHFKDEQKPDEVFFDLKRMGDEEFSVAVRLYAGAREQEMTASGGNKRIYGDKAAAYLVTLTTWLRKHMASSVDVTYQGKTMPLRDVVRGKLPSGATVRDYVNTAGAVLLASHFEDRSPDYPRFSVLVTRRNRAQAAQEALRWISGSVKSKQGAAVLDALELLDGDDLCPQDSRYAKHVLDALAQKGHGQVLNRSELVRAEAGVDYWTRFRIEPEYLAVVLTALVHSGDAVLSLVGQKLDAAAIDQFAKVPIGDVCGFKHLERPRDLPLAPLQDLFDLVEVPKGLIVDVAKRADGISELQRAVGGLVKRVVAAQSRLDDLAVWGKPLLSEIEREDWSTRLSGIKSFLESLQRFNTVGKLKNFNYDTSSVKQQREALKLVWQVEELVELVQDVAPLASYLGKAAALLNADHPWQERASEQREQMIAKIGNPKFRFDTGSHKQLVNALARLKEEYRNSYLKAHGRARLGPTGDKGKANLLNDPRLDQLQMLRRVDMLPRQQLQDLVGTLTGLRTCFQLNEVELETDPQCQHCGFRPADEVQSARSADGVLKDVDETLDALVDGWTQTLLANLADPTVKSALDLLAEGEGREELLAFIEVKSLPDPVSSAFLTALREALGGLIGVVVSRDELLGALTAGGIPCTVPDLRDRFEGYLEEITKGKDPDKVRVVLD